MSMSARRRHRFVSRMCMESICRARSELIANGRSVQDLAKEIGATNLIFQDLEDLEAAITEAAPELKHFDTSIFDGVYVTGDITEDYLNTLEQKRNDAANTLKTSQATLQGTSQPTSKRATVRVLPGPSALTAFEEARLGRNPARNRCGRHCGRGVVSIRAATAHRV